MKTFRDFMESSLYAPERGFYNTRVPTEDFYTAPELHPAFAGILADETAARLTVLQSRGISGPYSIVEMGSGSGALARAFLSHLRRNHPEWAQQIRYILVERSEKLLIESILSLHDHAAGQILGYTRLGDVLPCTGVFLSNELVDAFPVHLLEKKDGLIGEVYVQVADMSESVGDLSTEELVPYAKKIAPYLREGERHAVSLEALRWLRTVSRVMKAGALITIDYGHRLSLVHPNLPRAYYRHTTGGSLTRRPGHQDLTLSVNFEALVREGCRCGLSLVDYATLSRFLLDRGILDWMPSADSSDPRTYKERNRIKTLFHPEAMGDIFKVLIQEKTMTEREKP